MSMKAMEEFRDKLCEEFEKIARKPEMSAGDLETAHKLTDTIKNIDKICIMDESGEYSQAGDWEARGTYMDGNSYGGRRRDSMGRYSRNDDSSYRRGRSQRMYSRDGRGGYSRDGGVQGMMEHVEMMMDEATTDEEREAVRRFKKQLQDMA